MAKVKRTFKYRYDGVVYKVGDEFSGGHIIELEEMGYLEPVSFSSMTVKELKRLLDANGVEYDTKAKKESLVALLEKG